MTIKITVKIEIPEDGSVVVNETDLRNRTLPILTNRIQEDVRQQMPSKSKIQIEVYEGTLRIHDACK